jgi:hypothetical protein
MQPFPRKLKAEKVSFEIAELTEPKTIKDRYAMPLKHIFAAAILLCTLSGCATTGAENNSYATPAGIGPVRGNGINGY